MGTNRVSSLIQWQTLCAMILFGEEGGGILIYYCCCWVDTVVAFCGYIGYMYGTSTSLPIASLSVSFLARLGMEAAGNQLL